ncbi:hypothetical protein FQR65_LT01641 [Abscondita terminalis]|nr:hypothetical protein FQR65_LT01641 [Abscondita terminalis]
MDSTKPRGKKRSALPPRIPTPMPPPNNNNSIRSSCIKERNTEVHPSSVGYDIPKLISKDSYKFLDSDIGTTWINPRLISKVNMYAIKSTEYILPELRNVNCYFNRNLAHQKQGCGRSHDREWESAVNGRTKPRIVAVPTLIQYVEDVKRYKINRKNTRTIETRNIKNINPETKSINIKTEMGSIEKSYNYNKTHINAHSKSLTKQSKEKQVHAHQAYNRSNMQRPLPVEVQKVKGVLGYQSTVDYVEGGILGHDSGVYGMYSETRYAFAMNRIAGNQAQTSAAAAFFARAAQKLNLSSSPHRRKRHNSDDVESSGFCGVLQRCPPPVPPALLRRIGVKEVSGVGKELTNYHQSHPTMTKAEVSGALTAPFLPASWMPMKPQSTPIIIVAASKGCVLQE